MMYVLLLNILQLKIPKDQQKIITLNGGMCYAMRYKKLFAEFFIQSVNC